MKTPIPWEEAKGAFVLMQFRSLGSRHPFLKSSAATARSNTYRFPAISCSEIRQ